MNYLPFTEVFNDESGGNIKTQKGDYLEVGQIPIVDQGEDLIGGFTDEENKLCKSDLPIIIFGDHTRRFKFVDFPFGMGADGVKVLKPKIEADEKYLYYYLKALHLTDAGYDRHFKYLKRTEILIPPLPEQKRIAEVLDKADALREKRRLALQKLDTLLQSVFLEMFGDPVKNPMSWDVVTIRDLVSSVKYGTSQKAGSEGKYPILRMNNIDYQGGWNFSSLKYIEVPDKDLHKYIIRKGDIAFNRTNSKELVGKTAVFREDKEMILAGYLIRVRTDDENNPEYISAFLNSHYGKLVLNNMCKNIIGMANINAQELQDISIPKPPKKLQDQFAKIVEKVESNRKTLNKNIEITENLFQSLQQKAFKGELFEKEGREEIEEASAG
ncbi:MAG: restriction endonuclease subunit S [Acidobacteriota bacterium]|jgi:type I restriction enzyme S subunit|nr:restriction endonuclease subunit S [Acidobacteriota bacterium]